MNGKIAFVVAAALAGAAGCAIPLAEADVYQQNVCSSDSDCFDGSFCADIETTSLCVAPSVDLPDIVFEVRPVVGGGSSGPSFIGPLSLSSKGGTPIINLDLPVPPYVDVSPGRVFLPCGGDTAVPAKVTLFPVPGFAGLLEKQSYEADSMVDASGSEAFEVSVPPGLYDLYIEPRPDLAQTVDCEGSPPIFVPKQALSKDTGFAVHASAPLYLTGTIKLSQKEDFTKWFLEVVEPGRGQTISEVVQPEQTGIALEVPFKVKFDWTARKAFNPIIRLRPPEKSGKPVIHWSLAAVAQAQDGDKIPVKLDVSGIDTQPRKVAGQVFHDAKPVGATVTLHSTSIANSELARYETIVETDPAGRFEASIPRGEYQVIARPQSGAYAVGSTSWKVLDGDDCFCGNAVEVPSATTVAGSVSTAGGQLAEVDVRLTPAAIPALPYLGGMLLSAIPPRPASAHTTSGQFKLSVDAGLFDLSIVSPPASGYPWLVRPRQPVPQPAAGATPVVSLEPFQLQTPAVVRGQVTGPDATILSGATVRAWVVVIDPKNADVLPSVVQIAETVAGDDGSYVLLLPPSIKEGN